MSLEKIIQFIVYPKFEGWLLTVKLVFLGFSVFFGAFIIWALIKTSWLKRIILWDLKEFLFYRAIEIEKFKKEWLKIKKRLLSNIDAEIKLAIIEADNLLDELLAKKGYLGESFEEKTQQLIPDVIDNTEEISRAHKLRDDIVHDPSFCITLEEAKKAILAYEKILKSLDAI